MSIDQNVTMTQGTPDYSSAIALANAAALVSGVFSGLVGKDIANSVNGSRLMQEQLAQMICSRITKELIERHNKAKEIRLAGYQA